MAPSPVFKSKGFDDFSERKIDSPLASKTGDGVEAYLDYNSTTPVDPEVFEAMRPFLSENFGNASSIHKKGQAARHAVESAREKIADFLRVEPGDIVFTSGGTEADNLAVKGVMEALKDKRPHLAVSTIEHPAVLHPAQFLEKQGLKVSFIPVDAEARVDLDFLKRNITEKTGLVSVMHVNNEVGTIQSIRAISEITQRQGILFHTDAVQSFGKIPLHPEELGIDLMSMSGHKICGPKGVGALYIRKGLKIKSVTHGGHQEKNIRPGTENIAAIVGFGKAVELAEKNHAEEAVRILDLRKKLFQGLKKTVTGIRLNGDPEMRIYNTLNLSFEGLDGETLLMNLDFKNIYTSTGSACTAGSVEPSHVLLAMGLSDRLARAAVRFSLGRFTTDQEIDYALKEIPPIVERLRRSTTDQRGLRK